MADRGGLRRLEIPEGDAKRNSVTSRLGRRRRTGEISRIFGGQQCAALRTSSRKRAMLDIKGDRLAMMKAEIRGRRGPEPSNTRYGYVVPNATDRSQACFAGNLAFRGARRNERGPESITEQGFPGLRQEAHSQMCQLHIWGMTSSLRLRRIAMHGIDPQHGSRVFSTGSMSRFGSRPASPSLRTSTQFQHLIAAWR